LVLSATLVLKLLMVTVEDSMAHNEQQNKKSRSGGPQAHPSNQGPRKGASGSRELEGRGGNKVTQGRGSDTGNKGRN
jgi:hypothetical protein